MKSLKLLLLGTIIGWFLHEVTQQYLHPEQDPVAVVPKQTDPEQSILSESQSESALTASNSSLTISVPDNQIDGQEKTESILDSFLLDLNSGNFDRAVDVCTNLSDSQRDHCKSLIFGAAQSEKFARSDRQYLLELWMAENPVDVEAATLFVNQAVADGQFVIAVERLALLKSYLIESTDLDRVAQLTQTLASRAIIKLTLTEDYTGLQSILVKLIEMEPEQARWRYSLAKVQNDLQQYNEAINSLTYILFDSDYGERSTLLYEEIKKNLNLSNYSEVPLRKVGLQFLVTVIVNNQHELKLVLDTGASITTIKTATLKQIGLASSSKRVVTLNTAGGQIQSSLIALDNFEVGGQKVQGLDIASIELKDGRIDGLLGMNFLDHFRFIIDQNKRTLYLERK